MPNDFGVSFVPGQQPNPNGPPGQFGQGAGTSPIQQAIQLLSLRLPRIAGANAIAPSPLMNAPGAMGQPGAGLNGAVGNNGLLELLLHLAGLGAGGASNGAGSGLPGGPPLPRIIPGQLPGGTQPGPGTPTFPGQPPTGSPTIDRRNSGGGNRGGPGFRFGAAPVDQMPGPPDFLNRSPFGG